MSSSDDEDQSQLKGFVIITLPPPDNPSLGKTITAFTIPNNSSSNSNHSNPPLSPPPPLPVAERPPSEPLTQSALPNGRRTLLFSHPRRRRISWTLSGIALFALLTFCLTQSPRNRFKLNSSESSNELDRDDDDDDKSSNSFLFPLYPKLGVRERLKTRDLEVKLGKFSMFSSKGAVLPVDDGGLPSKVKRVSTVSNSALLPVNEDDLRDGLYYTQINVGSPPKPYFLDIDTGSDLTWIQCDAPCASCAKGAHPYYKPARGNILSSKDSFCFDVQHNSKAGYCESCHQCDYEIEYADRSSSMGVLSKDDLRLIAVNGTTIDSKVIIGCAYDQQGILLNSLMKTDGIIGLSRSKVSLPSQLAKQGIIDNVIGHCLTSDSISGGYMFLGGDLVPQTKMSWVHMLNDASMNYLAEVARVSYGSKQLSLDRQKKGNGRMVFDSGSSYTYFTSQAYSDLTSVLKDVSRDGFVQDASDTTLPVCWRYKSPIRSIKDVSKFFKPLTLQFGRKWWTISTYLHIPPEGYLIISNKGNVCLGILDGSDILDGSHILLGDISMRGSLIVYDNVKQRIGWMRSECVDLKPSNKNYLAEVARVSYGSKQLSLDRQKKGNGRMVFDSGSSYTYFTSQAYSDLTSVLKDVSRDGFVQDASDTTLPVCWRYKSPIRSIKDVSKFFKPLTLQFGRKWWTISTYLHIPPEGYLIISNKGNVCLGILDGSDILDGSHILLGDISMRGSLIVYDNVKQRIGWMRSECVDLKPSNKYLPSF